MKNNLQKFAFLTLLSFLFLQVNSQSSKQKPAKFDFLDLNENFYSTQERFNKQYKKFEKELARERKEKSEGRGLQGKEEEQEMEGYELYKRWESFMAPRVYPTGDKKLAHRAFEEYQGYLAQNASNNAQNKTIIGNTILSSTWQPIGPFGDPSGSNAGRINAIRVAPGVPNGYWACAPDGGLWSTSSGGGSWNTNTDLLTAIGCSDVVFDPTNPANMWMASGDGDAGDCSSLGVLKSTNGGATWSATGLAWTVSQGRRIFKLLINPLNKNTIFAATSIGLYRTQNGGTSWTAVVGAGTITDVEYKPGDTTTVYAVSTSFYLSTNGGTSFTTSAPFGANNRLAIAVTPANAAYVYVVASASSNSGFLGFWQSTNSAATWTSKATSPNLLGWASAGNDVGGQGWYTLSIAANPTNANQVVVGGVNVWRTLNGGTSWGLFAHWTGTGAPYVHADIHDLLWTSNTNILVGCDGGAFFTNNSGTSFAAINGNMNISQIYKIGNSKNTYNLAITGHQDDGTNLFTGGWSGTLGGDGMDCFIDQFNDQVMYGEQYSGSFNRTTNGGAAWSAITTGLTGSGAWVTPWHQDPLVANTLYAGYQEMFKTTNQGTNWAQIGTMGGAGQVVEFAVAPSNSQVIYVIKGNALYKTTNGGGTWANITGTLPTGSAQLTWVTVENDDPNSVWVTFSGYSAANKVFISSNGGTTWTNYSTGLPNLPTNCITYWNNTKDGVYVGCDVGVYYRDSLMANWIIYNAGLPNVQVNDLAIFYPLGKIRAATYGRGVWEADLYNNGAMAPIANFTSDKQFICPGMTVNYTDLSPFAPTSWSWVFQGGAPATSTVQNPSVVYAAAGTYSVSLTASNINGTSVMTKTLYITVSGTNALPLIEGFTAAGFPPPNWQNYDAATDGLIWTRNAAVGKPAASLMFDNYNLNASNTRDEMRTPKYSFAGYTNVKMYFDVAYARYDPTYSDSLAVVISTDCGVTWTQLYLRGGGPVGGTNLATAPDQTATQFVPTALQWRTDTVFLNAYSGMANVMLSFQNRGRYGQALYIDNVNIAGTLASMPPTAAFTYTAAAPCTGQNVFFSDASTNGPTSWNWTFAGGVPATSAVKNPTVSFATAGPHTVTLISTNIIGPSTPVTQTIIVNPTPTVTSTAALSTICSGLGTTLTGAGATTYTWSANAGAVTTSTAAVTPTVNTTYTVTGTTGGCSNTSIVSVTVNPSPTVAVNSSTVCSGTTANLTASGATTYTWNTGATTATLAITPTVTTVYTVTGTSGGCNNAKTTTVTVNANPTVAVNSSTICAGNFASLTANGATTYSWNTGATTNTLSVSPAITTVYTVTGTTSGCTDAKTSTVVVNPSPTVAVTNATVCSGSPASITASGATTYSWNTGATTNTISVSPTITTVYTVTGTTTGCTNTKTSTITVNALPTVSSNTSSICSGIGSATLTATGATTYSWNTGAGTAAIVVNPGITTNYTVTGTDALGCKNNFVTTVFVGATPTVAVNSSTVCAGVPTNLTASGATTYSWNTGATTTSISVSPLVTTVYTVSGTTGGCTGANTSTVTAIPLPTVSLAAATNSNCTIATGGTTVALTGSPAGGTYSGVGVVGSTFNPQAIAGTYTMTYVYTNTLTACTNSASATVTVNVCTGIGQLGNYTGNISVQPNPSSGKLTVSADVADTYDVNVYNTIGQLILSMPQNKSSISIDLTKYGKGMYNLVFKVADAYKNVKVVIE